MEKKWKRRYGRRGLTWIIQIHIEQDRNGCGHATEGWKFWVGVE